MRGGVATPCTGAQGTLCVGGEANGIILCPSCSGGFTSIYIGQNSLTCTLETDAFQCM